MMLMSENYQCHEEQSKSMNLISSLARGKRRHLACATLRVETSRRILTIRRRCYQCELTPLRPTDKRTGETPILPSLNGHSRRMRLRQRRRFVAPSPQAIHIEVNDRRCVERQQLRYGQTADDGDPERLTDF